MCKSIEKNSVTVEKAGEIKKITADNVVYAVGMKSVDKPYLELLDTAETVIPVGDCRKVDKVGGAVHQAFNAVVDLA